MDFEWSVKTENETEAVLLNSDSDTDTVSFVVINDDRARTYRCVANNSVGIGTMCSIEITGKFVRFFSDLNVCLCSYRLESKLLF